MKKSEKVNYVQKPIPSGPGKNQVTYDNLQAEKGGSSIASKLPQKNLIPGPGGKK